MNRCDRRWQSIRLRVNDPPSDLSVPRAVFRCATAAPILTFQRIHGDALSLTDGADRARALELIEQELRSLSGRFDKPTDCPPEPRQQERRRIMRTSSCNCIPAAATFRNPRGSRAMTGQNRSQLAAFVAASSRTESEKLVRRLAGDGLKNPQIAAHTRLDVGSVRRAIAAY